MKVDSSNVKIKLTKTPEILKRYADVIHLRYDVYDFMKEIVNSLEDCTVLEVGPLTPQQYNAMKTVTHEKEVYLDLGTELKKRCNNYISVDLDPNVKADFHCDVKELLYSLGEESLDAIIALEVLEHAPKFWELPEVFHKLLKPDGKLFFSTPFYCRHHDPRPDFWRLTEDGINLIFRDSGLFDIEITKLLWRFDDGQRPVHYTVVGIKK